MQIANIFDFIQINTLTGFTNILKDFKLLSKHPCKEHPCTLEAIKIYDLVCDIKVHR